MATDDSTTTAAAPPPPPPQAQQPRPPPPPPTKADSQSQSQSENLLTPLPLEHLPATHAVHAAFFRDVKNSAFLHSQLLARNPAFEYALIDASAVASVTHVQAAVFRAMNALLGETGLRTANVHSEIVFCLSPSNNITEAYRRYGISPATKDVIAIKVLFPTSTSSDSTSTSTSTPSSTAPSAEEKEEVWRHLRDNVEGGTPLPFTDDNIAPATDWAKVRKYYKLNGAAALGGQKKTGAEAEDDEVARRRGMEMLILGGMALRGL